MSKQAIFLSKAELKEAIEILSQLEAEERKQSPVGYSAINPKGEMSFSEIKKALILSQECIEPIFINAEPTHSGEENLTKKPYNGPVLPPHLNTFQLSQGTIGNCWFLSVLNSILVKLYGPKAIASMIIDLETELLVNDKLIILGKLLGLSDDKKVMIRLIKNGLPRYCIVDKSEILNAGQDRSDFYIQAIVKATVSLFFDGDYQKVTGMPVDDGYRALFLGTEPKKMCFNLETAHRDACYLYDKFYNNLNEEQQHLIFRGDKNLINKFCRLIGFLRSKYPSINFSCAKKFSDEMKKTKQLPSGVDINSFYTIVDLLYEYESILMSKDKYYQFLSKKLISLLKEGSNESENSLPMCLVTPEVVHENDNKIGLNNESVLSDGLITDHTFSVEKFIENLQIWDKDNKTFTVANVVLVRNPWGYIKKYDEKGHLIGVANVTHGVGIRCEDSKLVFYDSKDSVSQITPAYLLEKFASLYYLPTPITITTPKEQSQLAIVKLMEHVEAVRLSRQISHQSTQSLSFFSQNLNTGLGSANTSPSIP